MNLRPSGYEPDELPGCSTPRHLCRRYGRPGSPGFGFVRPRSFASAVGRGAAPPRVICVGVMAGRAARSLGFVRPGSFCFCGRRGAACPLVCLQAVCLRCFCHDKGPLVAARWTAFDGLLRDEKLICVLQTWQRPTLPRLETKYHRRWGVSRPCSERERVQPPRNNHQVGETHIKSRSCSCLFQDATFIGQHRQARDCAPSVVRRPRGA